MREASSLTCLKGVLASSMIDTRRVCRGADKQQSWFSYTNDFSGQNLKLRKKSRKCLSPESHCTPLSSTLSRRGADLGGYRMKPPVHQRAQVLQGKTTGYRQCRNCRVSPWQLLSVLEPYRNVCPGPPSTEPPKEARLIPEPNPWWENKQGQDLTAQRRIFYPEQARRTS